MSFIGGWTNERTADRMGVWERSKPVREINAFEAEDTIYPFGHTALLVDQCNKRTCKPLVILYAKMGLHRYNLIQGKNYQFLAVKKYNRTGNFGRNSYYITLAAVDPANNSFSQFFHVQVNEHTRGILDLTCDVAVPRGDPNIYPHPERYLFHHDESLPKLPLENPFNDSQQFYLVKEAEVEDNDWIRLYLELAIATNIRMYWRDGDLSNLKILKVAIETTATTSQDPNEGRLNAKNTTVYISYRDSSKARVAKDVDRIAIVRRSFNDKLGCFSLVGHNQSSAETIIPKSCDEQSGCFRLVGVNQSSENILPKKSRKIQSVRLHKPSWLLCIPKWRKAYKNCGVGMARRLH